MVTETRKLIDAKIVKGEPLTLDERVYYHEHAKMDKFRSGTEPVLKTAQDVVDFFKKYKRDVTFEGIANWLDLAGVAK